MTLLTAGLFAFGYPASVVVIARWFPVVRERRQRWFVVHALAVSAIVAGWALRGEWRSVAINATWLVISIIWYRPSWSDWRAGQ
jgi:hypothetical protein